MRRTKLSVALLIIMLLPAGAQSWIRINQLGYLPNTVKVAVYISQNPDTGPDFTVRDALTDKVVYKGKAVMYDGSVWGMASAARLDFTGLTTREDTTSIMKEHARKHSALTPESMTAQPIIS